MTTYKRPTKVDLPPELDSKATDLYARMAVYIDANIYKPEEERDVARLYEYIYHITYMLCCKSKNCVNAKELDDFCIYVASRVYMRMTNPRQFSVESGERKLEIIKSVLNYLKFAIPKLKVRYQEENYVEIFSDKHGADTQAMSEAIKSGIQDSYNSESQLGDIMVQEMENLPAIVRHVVYSSPYKKQKLICHEIYVSCLLTLLNNFTLSNKDKNKLRNKDDSSDAASDYLVKVWNKQAQDCIILWRLDESYRDYIDILVKKVKHKLIENIERSKSDLELPDETLQQIMLSSWNETSTHNEEDD